MVTTDWNFDMLGMGFVCAEVFKKRPNSFIIENEGKLVMNFLGGIEMREITAKYSKIKGFVGVHTPLEPHISTGSSTWKSSSSSQD